MFYDAIDFLFIIFFLIIFFIGITLFIVCVLYTLWTFLIIIISSKLVKILSGIFLIGIICILTLSTTCYSEHMIDTTVWDTIKYQPVIDSTEIIYNDSIILNNLTK